MHNGRASYLRNGEMNTLENLKPFSLSAAAEACMELKCLQREKTPGQADFAPVHPDCKAAGGKL